MSHRSPNIYHGLLSPESMHDSQVSQPVHFTGGPGARIPPEATQYLPRRDTYPNLDQRHQLINGPPDLPYGHHDYRLQQSINMGGHGQLPDNPYQNQFPSPLDQRYMPLNESYPPNRENSTPFAFPQPGMPHPSSQNGRPSMTHGSRSYPSAQHGHSYSQENNQVALDPSIVFDGDLPPGHPLPDPGEFLRLKLGLKPGDPISLWSLPDPEPGQRPPHPYPLLVRLAIYGSPNGRLTLKQIYEALEQRFEWYRNQPKGAWKGSIRHNLSLNQVFRNVHRPLTEPGKGNYWEIDHSKGEGYKRDRKRKTRKSKGDKSQNEDEDDDDDDFSACEIDFGMVDSDQSDSSQRPPSQPRASPSSARAARRPSPYSSPTAGPSRRLDSTSSPRLHGVGDFSHPGYESGGSSSPPGMYLPGATYNASSPRMDQGSGNALRNSVMNGTQADHYYYDDIASSPDSNGYISGGSSHGYRDARRRGAR